MTPEANPNYYFPTPQEKGRQAAYQSLRDCMRRTIEDLKDPVFTEIFSGKRNPTKAE